MTSRCPKCGKNNYGDVQKCSFCGAPLVFIPGEELPEITEEDIQERLSNIKADRIRNPLLIGGGAIIATVGVFTALILFFVFMLFVFSPGDVEPYTEAGAFHYDVPGGTEYIFGEITLVIQDKQAAETESFGYLNGYYAYEIDGDSSDRRSSSHEVGTTEYEPDLWIYSEEELGEKGDMVLVKVTSKSNAFGEKRAVSQGKAGWGGSGWFSGGWIFILPGFLLFLGGAIVTTIGLVGKVDKSVERLVEEDKEFRRQQLMLREAARKQMKAQQQQQQWASYTGEPQTAGTVPYQDTSMQVQQDAEIIPGQDPMWQANVASESIPTPGTQELQAQSAAQPLQAPAYQAPQIVPQQAPAQPQYQAPPPAQLPPEQ